MAKKDYLQQKYEEINKLKNKLISSPKEHWESILKAMDKIFMDIEEHLKKHKSRVVKTNKIVTIPDKVFTVEELSKFNGKDGNKAYVAVDGIVYDLSKLKLWQQGSHYGLLPGQDLTKYFYNCHSNNKNVLKNAEPVGKLLVDREEMEFTGFTRIELAKYDGRNGAKAYVAINGVVYDVTKESSWQGGNHYGVWAGKDLSEYFNVAHKKEEHILEKLKVVGQLID